jgi:N-acetylmuramoyl-L-alanine amidase
MGEVYSGTITLPGTQPNSALLDLGDIIFNAVRGSESASLTGINVKIINESAFTACEVVRDFASIKLKTDSGWWDDYLPASVGMRDKIVGYENGYFKLSFGGYILTSDVILTPEKTLLTNRVVSAAMEVKGDVLEIRFGVTENVPVDAKCKDGVFKITLYNTPDGGRWINMPDNPMFKTFAMSNSSAAKTVTYTFDLVHPDNWYGFDVAYEGGFIIIIVKNPMKKIEGDKPLAGLTIAVDAGHGGNHPGAMGFLGIHGKNEKDLALDAALALRDVLREMGADVVMTRETDIKMVPDGDAAREASERAVFMNAANPDLAISIHYNSMGDDRDNWRTRGLLPLYTNDAGRLASQTIGNVTGAELNRSVREMNHQTLVLARNHKYPTAYMEMAFITCPDEYEFAQSAEGVRRSAEALAKGVVAWIDAQAQFIK